MLIFQGSELIFYVRSLSKIYLFFYSIFYVYVFFVIKYTQFPIILNDEMRSIIGQNVFRDSNFLPFANLKYNLKYIILNTVMTIPFGFGICFLIKTSFRKIILLGFGLGFLLELMQLIIALIVGFTFRYVDVNDIIFNTCGAVIGYSLFKLLHMLFKSIVNKYNVKLNSLLKYIYHLE